MQLLEHFDSSSGRLRAHVRHEDLHALQERIHLSIHDSSCVDCAPRPAKV